MLRLVFVLFSAAIAVCNPHSARAGDALIQGKSTSAGLDQSKPVTNASTVIRTKAALDEYLQRTPNSESPLRHFSPLARQRFIDQIKFGKRGAGISYLDDLRFELTDEEIREVLNLFGEQDMAAMVKSCRLVRLQVPPDVVPVAELRQPPTRIEQRYDSYLRATAAVPRNSRSNEIIAFSQLYDQWIASAQKSIKVVNDNDLILLYRAANFVAYMTFERRYGDDMTRDINELEARGFAVIPLMAESYSLLLIERRFDDARVLLSKHPGIEGKAIPELRETSNTYAGLPTMLTVSPDRFELERQRVNLNRAAQVIVITDPGCHFCRDAENDLQAYPEIRTVLKDHALYLSPQYDIENFEDFQKWNREHSEETMHIAYLESEWPMIEQWGMPSFYFLKNGKVVNHMVGWRGEKSRKLLQADLQQIGLLR